MAKNPGGLSVVDTQRCFSTFSSVPELFPKALNPNTNELMATQTSMTERMISRELMPFRSTWRVTQITRVALLLCAVYINGVLLTVISMPFQPLTSTIRYFVLTPATSLRDLKEPRRVQWDLTGQIGATLHLCRAAHSELSGL